MQSIVEVVVEDPFEVVVEGQSPGTPPTTPPYTTERGCQLINTARSGPIAVAWHDGGPLFPHPIEVHQSNDVIATMYDRLIASHRAGGSRQQPGDDRPQIAV